MAEKMKWNENLIYITLTYLFINAAFFFHAISMNSGGALGYVFIFPFFLVNFYNFNRYIYL
jgi:hypothetical protein